MEESATDDLELAIAAARAGGAIVADGFGRHRMARSKARNDPVTEVDHRSEEAIVELITRHRPRDSILGEEGTASGGDPAGGRRWLVDPLDGTVNFIHGLPHVSVSVGLWDGDRPVTGVVLDPIHDELFAAASGGGATMNGSPISVSGTERLSESLVITGFPYDHHRYAGAYATALGTVLAEVNGIRRIGSAALDLCYVAMGRVDGSWEYQLSPWDLAGGLVVLAEAGGRATDPWGNPCTPYRTSPVTSNGLIHEGLRSLVAANVPPHLEVAEHRR